LASCRWVRCVKMRSRKTTSRSWSRLRIRLQSPSKISRVWRGVGSKAEARLEKLYLEDEIRWELRFEEIAGRSEALCPVLEQVKTVAPSDSPVRIYGETGTAKELIAHGPQSQLAAARRIRQAELRGHFHRPVGKRDVRA
jgi:transcriptional regulator with GAF, ATPase, and Fis domain